MMHRLKHFLIAVTWLGAWTAAACQAQAFTPTPAQLEQFKNLSPAEQRRLAEQAGIDLNAVGVGPATTQPVLSEATPAARPIPAPNAHLSTQERPPAGEQALPSKSGLPLFGSDLFAADTNGFRPPVTVPVPAEYVLGPGDTIIVQLYGKENSTYSLVVNREGQIQFPQIGPVNLAGLSFSKAQAVIENIVSEQKIGVKASITMGALRTIRIFVLGDVKRPGSFTVGALATLTNALFESGGVTDVGSLRNIQLKRNGHTETTFDLYDLLLRGDTSKDVRLMPGDVIFVPPIGTTIGIAGEVKRPAIYEVKDTLSAGELVSLAGGLTSTAHANNAQLMRINAEGERNFLNLDLNTAKGRNFTLTNGDRLTVSSALEFVNNQIQISGYAKRPGYRAWRPDLRFSDVIQGPLDLLPNPDINVALIQRFDLQTLEVSTEIFSPKLAWTSPQTSANPRLQQRDIIHLFNYRDARDEALASLVEQLSTQANFSERRQTVSVSGSVRFPGTYPRTAGMTTAELILLAGGLLESAMGTNGEITRYGIDENRQRSVRHLPVDFTEAPVILSPGDTLQVQQIPLWKNKETVEVAGEVMFPGTYTIVPGETLSSVLLRAGGLTAQAYAEGAVFSRKDLRQLEAQRIAEFKGKLESDIAAQTVAATEGEPKIDIDEAQSLLKNLESLKPLGRMVIDLPRIMEFAEFNDFELEDGDRLAIPRFKPSVTVVGEVQYPTSHFYEQAFDAFTYIDRSGGFKKHADQARVYIVKANGLVIQPPRSRWFRADTIAIKPGDTIVVPLETDKLDKLSVWSNVTQIMYQAALGAAAVLAL